MLVRRLRALALVLPLLVALALAGSAYADPVTVSDPFGDQGQMVNWSTFSFWLQPWRAWQDTWPASRMSHALGANFVPPKGTEDQTAQLMQDVGLTHARTEVGWNSMSYADPSQMASTSKLTARLQTLQAHGIRPLILLNANAGDPCPNQTVTLTLAADAPAGATSVQLDSASVALVKPGYTGFDQYSKMAGVLITSVDSNGVAQLSQPLQSPLAAGPEKANTLAFQPFFPQFKPDGTTPYPQNQETLHGWLEYVAGVTAAAKAALGNDHFDLEVWNEMSFASGFLNADFYYSPDIPDDGQKGEGSTGEILKATADYVRDPANGLPDVGVGNGFANQQPFASGALVPLGVTAIDKHPYSGGTKHLPADFTPGGSKPLDALGNLDSSSTRSPWVPNFVPTVTVMQPEQFLAGRQTETVARDLAPFDTMVGGTPHGRDTHPDGGPPPSMWVTEFNLSTTSAHGFFTSPDGQATSPISDADKRHFEAKVVLRSVAAWVGKGVKQFDFYAIGSQDDLDIADQGFFDKAAATGTYPGVAAGGEAMVALQRFMKTMKPATNVSPVTPITLQSIYDPQGGYQFAGDGTAQHPNLYNADLVQFDPFQLSLHKWVVPTYIMTLDMATLYRPGAPATDETRQDLPPQVMDLTIGGPNPATAAASLVDPLTGASSPLAIVARTASTITVRVPETDYPRELVLTDG